MANCSIWAEEDQNEKCKRKILNSYPEAKCYLSDDADACKKICEKQGADTCKETRGEIRKLHCKNVISDKEREISSTKPNGPITCCCTVICEDEEKTALLLGKNMFIVLLFPILLFLFLTQR